MAPLNGIWLGRRNYGETYRFQCSLLEARRSGAIDDVVLFLEHAPTITSGKGGHAENLLSTETALNQAGIDFVRTDRGGDVTLHAPGQLVCYPIVQLPQEHRDVRRYVRGLADVMRALVARHGVDAGRIEEHIGIWADASTPAHWPGETHVVHPVKLGAIGVRISRWVTMHGFALNLATDMSLFAHIVPCGIKTLGVASVEQLTGHTPVLVEEARAAHSLISTWLGLTEQPFQDHAQTPLSAVEQALLQRHTQVSQS